MAAAGSPWTTKTVSGARGAPATPVEHAAALLRTRKIGALPVVEGNTLVGIVSESDLLGALVQLCNLFDPTTAIELECSDDPDAPARIRHILQRPGGQVGCLTAIRSHGDRQR
ncbi:MAG: CBS domain-containing protein, partial [Candidatus Binatia bacterium]